jgi:hypothetical protein
MTREPNEKAIAEALYKRMKAEERRRNRMDRATPVPAVAVGSSSRSSARRTGSAPSAAGDERITACAWNAATAEGVGSQAPPQYNPLVEAPAFSPSSRSGLSYVRIWHPFAV